MCLRLFFWAVVLWFCGDEALLAQRRGGSFGGSRSSSPSRSYSSPSPSRSYSSPSPSYSSPSSPVPSSRSSGSSFGGSRSSGGSSFGSSRSPSSVSQPPRSTPSSSGAKSYGVPRRETYGGQTYSYKGSSGSIGYNRSNRMIPRNTYSYNDVYTRRNSYYSGIGFAPPSYIGYTSPSYGMFSTLFLLSALQNLQAQQNAMFFYNHWNSPSMMAYRNDMRTAAQSDPQAAQRLRDLEARVAQLEREKAGVRDTTYLPEGVDSTVVLSNDALGVKSDDDDDKQAVAEKREKQESGGSGMFWFVLIGGGAGLWWFLRRRKRQREQMGGGGSFS